MLQHVADDVGQVLLRHYLLLVAQLRNALRHTARLLRSQLQAQLLEISGDIGLAGILAQRILTLTTETLWHQLVIVQLVFRVAIGMNASHLREDILTDNRLIGGYGDATETLDHARDVVQLVLVDVRLGVELILQNNLYRGQWRIATTLAQTVHGDVQSLGTTQHGSQRVRHRQIVVVVGVEVEMHLRIALHHLTEILHHLQGIHHAQSVREHETRNLSISQFCQGVHQLIYIFWRILHAVRPVLQIEVDREPLAVGILHLFNNIGNVLLGGLVQLVRAMLQRTLCQQVDDTTATVGYPIDRLPAIHKAQHLDTIQTVYLTGITAYHRHSVLLTVRHARRSHLDAVHIDLVQQLTRHHEFLVGQERDAIGLLAIAQGRVHNLYKRRLTPQPLPIGRGVITFRAIHSPPYREELEVGLLPLIYLIFISHQEVDVVKTIHQTMLLVAVDVKMF